MTDAKTLIIGAGLSGLAVADALAARGEPYVLVEARSRLGGRIETAYADGAAFDLGPTWFWEGQPRMAAIAKRFGLEVFEQFAQGAQCFEDDQGHVQRGPGFASMEGSLRIAGGMGAIIDAMADGLDPSRVRCDAAVVRLTKHAGGIVATFADGETLTAETAVLAIPPRIASQITFDPPLPDATMAAMHSIPTWMAGQAKAVVVYDEPFWREAGLSGDATNRKGPLIEIHDASPAKGGPFALFGFIGVPPKHRMDEPALRDALRAQLARLFGAQAAKPRAILVKDWAREVHTAIAADHAPLMAHPAYGMPQDMREIWGGRLRFAGTEVGAQFGGYAEGALEAAEAALLTQHRHQSSS